MENLDEKENFDDKLISTETPFVLGDACLIQQKINYDEQTRYVKD